MEQIPDIFRRGKVAYDELCLKLFEIYKILPMRARKELFLDKGKNPNDSMDAPSFKNMRKDFNALVQYALLDVGTSTDKVSYLEMLYIADIGDLEVRLDHYLADTLKKSDKRFKCTYLMLPDQLPEDVLYFKKCIFEYIEPMKVHIMKAFQVAQKLNRKMKINEYLLHDFAELYEAYLSVDKRMEKEDPMIAVNKMKDFFFEHIADYKSKVKSLLK
ncbi:MAG: hypothetical protein MJ213_05730 [Bacilli bacterium]|nr:hypothetical protein [Bacilli bacterium]